MFTAKQIAWAARNFFARAGRVYDQKELETITEATFDLVDLGDPIDDKTAIELLQFAFSKDQFVIMEKGNEADFKLLVGKSIYWYTPRG